MIATSLNAVVFWSAKRDKHESTYTVCVNETNCNAP